MNEARITGNVIGSDVRVELYRRNGVWHICIAGPRWLIDDLVSEAQDRTMHMTSASFRVMGNSTDDHIYIAMKKADE